MANLILGEPFFDGSTAIHNYCRSARDLIRPLGNELRIASEELKAALKEFPGGSMLFLGADKKIRARIVASHLVTAAEGVEATCAGLVRTYLSYEKHFLQHHQDMKASRPRFDPNR